MVGAYGDDIDFNHFGTGICHYEHRGALLCGLIAWSRLVGRAQERERERGLSWDDASATALYRLIYVYNVPSRYNPMFTMRIVQNLTNCRTAMLFNYDVQFKGEHINALSTYLGSPVLSPAETMQMSNVL